VIYYQLEFKVSGPNFSRHNVAVLVARRDTLFTFNAQCPDDRWEADGAALRAAADSFSLLIDADR
jgi:PsbP